MKFIYSLFAAPLLMFSSIGAYAESFEGKISSKKSSNVYEIIIDGKKHQLNFAEATDSSIGLTVFVDGPRNGDIQFSFRTHRVLVLLDRLSIKMCSV